MKIKKDFFLNFVTNIFFLWVFSLPFILTKKGKDELKLKVKLLSIFLLFSTSPPPVEELLALVLPAKQSLDLDMDPCKSPVFLGDISFPEANFSRRAGEMFDVRDTFSEPRLKQGWVWDGIFSPSRSIKVPVRIDIIMVLASLGDICT